MDPLKKVVDRETLRRVPKIDLHRHLDGDVRPEIIWELAQQDKVPLPVDSPEGLFQYFRTLEDQGLQALFQEGFGLVTSLMNSPENLEKVAYEEVRTLAEDGIIYGEIRFAPQYHTGTSQYYHHSGKERLTYREIIKAVNQGLLEGEKDFGVKTRLIICIGREVESEEGVQIARAALESLDQRVVALDLACDEYNFPPKRHQKAFEFTFGTPLKRTVHAGELSATPYQNMLDALTVLKADRLSHVVSIHQHEDLLKMAKEQEVGLEMCPGSNLFCGHISSYKDLNISKLMDLGLLVSIHSDDPAMFNFTLTDVLYRLAEEHQWGLDKIRDLQIRAARSAFLEEKEKEELVKRLEKE